MEGFAKHGFGFVEEVGSSLKRVMRGWPALISSPSLACISMPAWALTGSPGLARPAPRRWTAQPTCLQSMEAR